MASGDNTATNLVAQQYRQRGRFDLMMGSLTGRPDVIATRPSTLRAALPLVGDTETFVVQTFRERDGERAGDWLFIEHITGDGGTTRIVVPPNITRVVARQRDELTGRSRRKAAQAAADDRKRRGIVPGFMKDRHKRKGKA